MSYNNSSNRRNFLKASGTLALGAAFIPEFLRAQSGAGKKIGIQLYTVRKEMLADAGGTLKSLARIGYNEIESARSDKGNYYGLAPAELKHICGDLNIKVVSGHVHIDNDWQRSVDQAAEVGQPYLICSTLPSEGQTVENYQRCADSFNKAAEDCKKVGITFGYHNHEYEFEKVGQQTLYNILLDRTDPATVRMELDLGWVIATGADPQYYFDKYPGRFPLWHLKDMDLKLKHSTEFGKGNIDLKQLLSKAKATGLKHFFVEQEEFTRPPMESAAYDYNYVSKLL
jgi:sugar phosphate isomerase/epimerase